jgi:glycosyltransferase involved in cell wall biosynthesis
MASNGTSKSSRLRVLQIGKYFAPIRGGIESHLRDLCSELRKSVDLKVIVANDSLRSERELIDGIDVLRLPRAMTLASAPICPTMIASIRREKADIVHLHLPNPAAAIACLLARPAGALVITWHSDIVRQRRLVRLYKPLERLLLNRCAAIIATSPAYVASSPVLTEHADRCHLIPFGIYAEQFDDALVDQSAVRELRRRFGSRVVLSVGRLVHYKGIKFLIRAMAKVDAKLVIIGDGPLRADLEREAASAGLPDRVVFLGDVDGNLNNYFHASDVFALPSCERSEAFGIVQLEAMACGIPVVNTSIDTGVPYVSPDGVTGLTVASRSPDEMAAALNRLLDDQQLREKMGRAARARVFNEFGIVEMAAQTLNLYRSVLRDRGKLVRSVAPLFKRDQASAAIDEDAPLPQQALRTSRD